MTRFDRREYIARLCWALGDEMNKTHPDARLLRLYGLRLQEACYELAEWSAQWRRRRRMAAT